MIYATDHRENVAHDADDKADGDAYTDAGDDADYGYEDDIDDNCDDSDAAVDYDNNGVNDDNSPPLSPVAWLREVGFRLGQWAA